MIRRIERIAIALSFWIVFWGMTGHVFAQDSNPFLTKDDLPDGVMFLPAPPTVSSEPFKTDLYFYEQGKAARETQRGAEAKTDSDCSAGGLAKNFSAVIGIKLSQEATPHTFSLIARTIDTAITATRKPKKHHSRPRPYIEFKEPSLLPDKESGHNPNASYPSGHSTAGWAVALLLVELYPQAQDAILKRGYEYGESRVIAGFHYESDVAMGRLVASAAIARLHADPEFQKALVRAKNELTDLLNPGRKHSHRKHATTGKQATSKRRAGALL